jgi:hypothetical protein
VTGFAWRIQIPTGSVIYGSNLVNNLLEFLGMAINILLELRSCTRGQNYSILALGDNTSAVGWLHNTAKLGPGGGSRKAHSWLLDTSPTKCSTWIAASLPSTSKANSTSSQTSFHSQETLLGLEEKRTLWPRTTRLTTSSPSVYTLPIPIRYQRTSPSPSCRTTFYPGLRAYFKPLPRR